MQYYSQPETQQDKWVIEEVFPDNGRGFFVDIGAADGVRFSNTYALEQLGWTGICVEPRDDDFAELRRNRPGSQCISCCIGHTNGKCNFVVADLDELLSGVQDTLGYYMGMPVHGDVVQKKMMTPGELLTTCGAPSVIEYLSIDTEGNEYEIIRTISFHKYTFKAITVEHNFTEPLRSQILALLSRRGYKRVKEVRWEDFYLHKELCSG